MDTFDQELRASIRAARVESFVAKLETFDAIYNKLMSKPEASWDDFDKLEVSYMIAGFKLITGQMLLMREADLAR